MKKLVLAVPVLALALGGTTACATKKMVKTQVGEVNNKVETLSKSVEENQERTRVNEVTLSEDKGGFKFGKATMPDTAKADLDKLVQQLKAEPNGAYIEIEGHTDNAGPADLNYKLGMERAEAVKR